MKNKFILLLIISVLFALSCQKDKDNDDIDISDTTDGYAHEEQEDYLWNESSEELITLNGNSISSGSSGVVITGSKAIITRAGNYKLSGNLSDGQIIVDTDTSSIVRIILNNCSITNSSGPALLIKKSRKTIINLFKSTNNYLVDGANYTEPEQEANATIYSKSDLTIFGDGSLTVSGNYEDGISGKDGVIIKNGVINVTSEDDGICGKDYLIVRSGSFIVNTTRGDALRSDDASNNAVGYILIDDGLFYIRSGRDGLAAQSKLTINKGKFQIVSGGGSSVLPGELSSKGMKGLTGILLNADSVFCNSSDNALHSNSGIEISSGFYELASAKKGIHANQSVTIDNANILITKSDEGIESKFITVNGGNTVITSTDDSFNATAGQSTENDDQSCVYLNGGFIVLNGSNGDPLDSNGSIIMQGGTVLIHGPSSSPEVAIDYNGKFDISGGFLIASGTNSNMTIPPSQTSTQNSIKLMFKDLHQQGMLFHIQDDLGNNIVTFKPHRQYQSVIVSSSELKTGEKYRVFLSGNHSGEEVHGLYNGGNYTPGNEVTSFTITDRITVLNNL